MRLFKNANDVMLSRGYSCAELTEVLGTFGFSLSHAVEAHPFFGTSVGFVRGGDGTGVFESLTLRSSGVNGYLRLTVMALVLPCKSRIVEVLEEASSDLQLNHDVRTKEGESRLRETLGRISTPVRMFGKAVAPTLLRRTVQSRRIFSEIASQFPTDLDQLHQLSHKYRLTASAESIAEAARLF